MTITPTQRQSIIQRAKNCCEYCRLSAIDTISPFHVDHIIPLKHKGTDDLSNLCLACYQCNSYKGTNMAAADPLTNAATFLFHPRNHQWSEHFHINSDGTLSGLSPEGRATIEVLRINDEERVAYRHAAMQIKEYPCPAAYQAQF